MNEPDCGYVQRCREQGDSERGARTWDAPPHSVPTFSMNPRILLSAP